MLIRFTTQILELDVSLGVTSHRDHSQAGHNGAGRIGSMRGGRNQADIAVRLPLLRMPCTNHQQPGILALRTRVGLE